MKHVFYSYSLERSMRQVRKDTARKLFDAGIDVYFQSSNMPFDSIWQRPMIANKNGYSFVGYTFDSICSDFKSYNCDNERGRYIHFYADEIQSMNF